MKIAITGAGGFVGKELARFFSARHHVVPLPRHSLDITDGHAVRRMVINVRPDLIISSAKGDCCVLRSRGIWHCAKALRSAIPSCNTSWLRDIWRLHEGNCHVEDKTGDDRASFAAPYRDSE